MNHHIQAGISLIEALLVVAIVAILTGFSTINLLGAQQSTTQTTSTQTIITDIKHQQIKAMTGETEGRSIRDYYGIHFNTTSYVLFHGTNYNPNDNSNFTISLNSPLQFTNITFTNNNLIFIPVNGEIYGYSSVTNSFVVKNTITQQQTIVNFNYLGVITQLQ